MNLLGYNFTYSYLKKIFFKKTYIHSEEKKNVFIIATRTQLIHGLTEVWKRKQFSLHLR